jgi:GNAT superfamily N-acetyltransferase
VTADQIRVARPEDVPDILDVCRAALGWNDPTFDESLFRWKHLENAFGPSLLLVSRDDDRVKAVRPMMRWRFRTGDRTVGAVRAVDTATHPSAQGQGLFTKLTTEALQRLVGDSEMVFNTPNDKSRPGYLKLGWEEAGRIPFGIRFAGGRGARTSLTNRVPATKPSLPTPELGMDVGEALSNMSAPIVQPESSPEWRTDHSLDTLRWRFVTGPISYRAVPTGDGYLIVRVRQRGRAVELVVAHQIGSSSPGRLRKTLTETMRSVGADHALTTARFPGTITTSRAGPMLTIRTVGEQSQPRPNFSWTPGDIELF